MYSARNKEGLAKFFCNPLLSDRAASHYKNTKGVILCHHALDFVSKATQNFFGAFHIKMPPTWDQRCCEIHGSNNKYMW
jgi:hypothetical protein